MIDRGNAELSEEELKELLGIYQAQIDAGVQTIMISDSSVNGIRMSEHKELLRYLKEDMGFDGFLVTDWNAVKTTSAETYKEKIITVINSGTDMLMEVDSFEEVHRILIDAVYNGDIPQSRIDDAARRIIKVKKEAGLFENPFQEDAVYNEDLSACRSVAYKTLETQKRRDVARVPPLVVYQFLWHQSLRKMSLVYTFSFTSSRTGS